MARTWILMFLLGLSSTCFVFGKETARIEVVPYLVMNETNPSFNVSMSTHINVTCTGPPGVVSELCIFELNDYSRVRWLRRPHTEKSDRYKSMTPGDRNHPEGLPKESCGITVYPPFDDAYGSGTWKCWMGYHYHEVVKGMVIRTDPMSDEVIEAISLTNDIFVKKGDEMKLECEASHSIKFCFMRSPNGTVFAVTGEDVKSNNTLIKRLVLESDDLDMGICSTTIEKTDASHNGNWTCQLDLENNEKIETNITVNVKDSYLLGSIEKNNPKTVLQCKKFPLFEADITACHWILPNGSGIYKQNTTEYTVLQNKNKCTLELKEWREDYAGDWKCYGQFVDKTQHVFDALQVISLPSTLPVTTPTTRSDQ